MGHGRPNFLSGDNFRCLSFQNFLTLRRINVLHYTLSNSSLLAFRYKFDTESLRNYVIPNDVQLTSGMKLTVWPRILGFCFKFACVLERI